MCLGLFDRSKIGSTLSLRSRVPSGKIAYEKAAIDSPQMSANPPMVPITQRPCGGDMSIDSAGERGRIDEKYVIESGKCFVCGYGYWLITIGALTKSVELPIGNS